MDIGLNISHYNELLIGCVSNHSKKLYFGNQREWQNLVTLDINSDLKPESLRVEEFIDIFACVL